MDSIVPIYTQRSGVSLSQRGGGSSGSAVINSDEFTKFQSQQEHFVAQQVELYVRYLRKDSRAGEAAFVKEKEDTAALQQKPNSILYVEGIQPSFNALKA